MSNPRRRFNLEETLERLRLASCECSGLGLEETEESEMEQTTPARKINRNKSDAVKEFCSECHLAFGLAETRVAVDRDKVVHEDCYAKILHRAQQIANRIRIYIH